ncbi:MAG: hypothetical protein KJS92_10425 [Bacteroidetes bacterium]|nr:hypothetical protein [Bacteroidota bacterium]
MKNLIVCMLGLLQTSSLLHSQNTAEDFGKVVMGVHIPDAAGMSPESKKFLAGKLTQLLTQNGMAGTESAPRFALAAIVNIGTKDIIPGPPQMIAQQLELNLIIGDAVANRQFESYSLSLKGVGTNEPKAFNEAFKGINPANEELRAFIQQGKAEIMAYYEGNCDNVIRQAGLAAQKQEYEAAIYQLSLIPDVATTCYRRALDSMAAWHREKQNKEGKALLTKAKGIWAAGQNTEAALEAISLLQQIAPEARCQKEVQTLIKSIEDKIKADAKARWDQQIKEYNDSIAAEIEQRRQEAADAAFRRQAELQRLRNYHEIALEQARNQPPVTINHINWR